MAKVTLLLLVLFLSFVTFIRVWLFYQQKSTYKTGQKILLRTSIVTEPKISGKTQRFSIRLPDGTYISVSTLKYPLFLQGEPITLSGKLEVVGEKNKTFLVMKYPQITRLEAGSFPVALTSSIRQRAANILEGRLNQQHAGLLLGIVFGMKKDMPEDFIGSLRSAGVMHVIAASGMNVSMVAGALYVLLERWLSRKKAILFSLTGVWSYAMLAGAEPSILRASLMASLICAASVIGKQTYALYMLYLTGVGMLLLQPGLFTDIGFQLSFLATAGILCLSDTLLMGARKTAFLQGDIVTTLAAQLATAPILLINFGSLNVLSILINALVLWTVPILMVLGSLVVLIGFVFAPLADVVVYITYPFVWYFEFVVIQLSRYPVIIAIDSMPASVIIGYYICLGGLVLWYRKRKNLNFQNDNGK